MADHWLVIQAKGPEWDETKGRREQAGWDEHATFIESCEASGFIVLGGPIGEGDGDDVLLIVDAESEEAVRARLADDPWSGTILRVESVRPWQVWTRGVGVPH